MKIYKIHENPIVRISFGSNKSISFEETTTEQVYDVFLKVFNDIKINKVIELKNFNPFKKPHTNISLTVTIRAEKGKKFDKSKSKTIYGLDDFEAMDIFIKNYKKYI